MCALKNDHVVIGQMGFGDGLHFLETWAHFKKNNTTQILYYIVSESSPYPREALQSLLSRYESFKQEISALLMVYPKTLTPGYHRLELDQGQIILILMIGEEDSLWQDWAYQAHTLDQWDAFRPYPQTKAYTPWICIKNQISTAKHAIVLGAGLAGAYLSRHLADQGWHIQLIDRGERAALGASANPRMVLFPTLSRYPSPLTRWMLHAFLYAAPKCKTAITQGIEGEWNGIAQLAWNTAELKRMQALRPWLIQYPSLAEYLDAESLSEKIGLSLNQPGLYIPNSGWINAIQWVDALIQHPNIECITQRSVHSVSYVSEQWSVEGYRAPIFIIAAGIESNQFEWTRCLTLSPKKGQMTEFHSNKALCHLKIPVCGPCHLLPKRAEGHWVGATFTPQGLPAIPTLAEDLDNQTRLQQMIGNEVSFKVKDHWTGIRATTFDHLPLVGPVPNGQAFETDFHRLSKDANAIISKQGSYHPGLFVFTGFGARGLTSIPLSASILSAQLQQHPLMLPRAMIESISPARVLIRKIIKGQIER